MPLAVAIHRLTEVEVEPDAERIAARIGGRWLGVRPADHQRCARNDPVLVGLDDPSIDPDRTPEVISVDDHHPLRHREPSASPKCLTSSSASPSQSRAC